MRSTGFLRAGRSSVRARVRQKRNSYGVCVAALIKFALSTAALFYAPQPVIYRER
jgi:hypothetical protein